MKNSPVRAARGAASHRRGLRAEGLARWWFLLHGYRCLARRYKTPVGEIDLIVRRGNTLVFVEVKSRPDLSQGAGAIPAASRARLRRAADRYLQANPVSGTVTIRFDLLVMAPGRWPFQIVNIDLV